jgi:RNA polymerase sigma factor (sigma-70 family)
MTSQPDHALLMAWRGGDQRSGAALYRKHAPSVGRFFRNKVAASDVADLIQATFLACFEHGERMREDASFRAFLLGFARNILFHHYRDKYRKHDKIDFGVSTVADLGATPTAILAGEQHEQQLLAALQSLPVEQQILLELHYWEGMRGPELAQFYGLPEGTIRTRLRRARQLLARAFEALETASRPIESLETWAESLREKLTDATRGAPHGA